MIDNSSENAFDPKSFSRMPNPSDKLQPEEVEAVRSHLSRINGNKIVYSQHEMTTTYPRGSKYAQMYENVTSGKAIIL